MSESASMEETSSKRLFNRWVSDLFPPSDQSMKQLSTVKEHFHVQTLNVDQPHSVMKSWIHLLLEAKSNNDRAVLSKSCAMVSSQNQHINQATTPRAPGERKPPQAYFRQLNGQGQEMAKKVRKERRKKRIT